MTQYYTFESRKKRALSRIWQQWDNKKSEVFERPYLKADDCKPGDIVFDHKAYVFRIEKVTPKTITLSGWYGDNDYRNPKRMSHTNFSETYRKTSESEVKRVKQLGARLHFVQKFEKVV